VAQSFKRKGYDKVFVIQGGWSAWMRADYPLEDK
jgi:3-mercaptopyruvate sulfurtransferase SseA